MVSSHLVLDLSVPRTIPQRLLAQSSRHVNGSVHASSMFNSDNSGELIAWFRLCLVTVTNWDCPHPDGDYLPMGASRNFREYISDIQSLGLKVWSIENDQRATGYLNLIDDTNEKLLVAGRADFIITDNACNLANYLFSVKFVVEIQSQDDDLLCELQMQLYLLILMNTRALSSVYGFLVYRDGRCRAYRARRSAPDGNCIYEENDTFQVFHIKTVIDILLRDDQI